MGGMVYWITGRPGSGKTTLGNALYYNLKKRTDRVVILDGNIVKDIVSNDEVSYSRQGRIVRAYQYSKLCQLLAGQGLIVICCTVSLYHEVQDWNRKNLPGYIEIFMDVASAILYEKNHRGLYGDKTAPLAGELPHQPDIVIKNMMDDKTDEYVAEVLAITPAKIHQTKDYKTYWDAYYKKDKVTRKPSDFAQFVMPYLSEGRQLLDMGCGNGRDSIFFAENGVKVTSVDLSSSAIEYLCNCRGDLPVFAVCDDFVRSKVLFSIEYQYCYSRWTMHSVDDLQQAEMIQNVYNALAPGGLFFIEVRTVNDDIFGLGEQVGERAYIYNDHYRRFLLPEELAAQLSAQNFEIVYQKESQGFSKTEESDPVLLRVIAKKKAGA